MYENFNYLMAIDFPSVKYSSMVTKMCLYFLVVVLDILLN